MAILPKGYKKTVQIKNQKVGFERRQEILDDITYKDTFLPKGVLEEDMDQAFIEFVKADDGLFLEIDGKKVPVIFLTIQRWTEFTQTWQFSDEYKNVELPFITIVRKPDIQQGQNQAGYYNIPGRRTYAYMKVPTWDGARRGIDLYKIPQPTPVDITYEVRFFTNRMKDLNKFNRIIQKAFQSRQCYIFPNGHPMPLHLETIGDESNIDTFEERRFYVQLFEMKLLGYLLDKEDFEIVPTVNRTLMTLEVTEKTINTKPIVEPLIKGREVTFNFVFKAMSTYETSFTAQYDVSFTNLVNIENITRIVIKINDVGVFDGTVLTSPLTIYANDNVYIRIYKTSVTDVGIFSLFGNTLT